MALDRKILLVTFAVSQKSHNDRLEKLLRDTFTVEHFSFLSTSAEHGKEFKSKVALSRLLHLLSVPALGVLITFQILIFRIVFRDKERNFVAESIQCYFDGNKNLTTMVLHLNRTLRQQKIRVLRAQQLILSATELGIDLVLFPEDSNYYASGIMITGLHKQGVKVGVVDYTIGKEAEFEVSKDAIVPNRNSLAYAKFARLFLDSTTRKRWFETKEFVDCFPGSLETISHTLVTPSYLSGLADFYLTSDNAELAYLRRIARKKAQVLQIEPIELTLAKQNPKFSLGRTIFGIFLPPNQLTDPNVVSRMSSSYSKKYKDMILEILEESSKICDVDENLVIFPHPRTYSSEHELITELSNKYQVSDDFVEFLSRMRCALIFSSAVFSALLAANIRVFNVDIYNYGYEGVFPKDESNFIEIKKIDDINIWSHFPTDPSNKNNIEKGNVKNFLETYF